MFAKKFRLPSSITFQGKAFTTDYYILKKKENTLEFNRYGFTISKKVDNRAAVRNRTKRVIRACFEELNISLRPGYDILVIIKKLLVDKGKTEVLELIKKDLKILQLL
jgi:ribonuclease P protein component